MTLACSSATDSEKGHTYKRIFDSQVNKSIRKQSKKSISERVSTPCENVL